MNKAEEIKNDCDEIIELIDKYFPNNKYKEHLRDCVHCLRDDALASQLSVVQKAEEAAKAYLDLLGAERDEEFVTITRSIIWDGKYLSFKAGANWQASQPLLEAGELKEWDKAGPEVRHPKHWPPDKDGKYWCIVQGIPSALGTWLLRLDYDKEEGGFLQEDDGYKVISWLTNDPILTASEPLKIKVNEKEI